MLNRPLRKSCFIRKARYQRGRIWIITLAILTAMAGSGYAWYRLKGGSSAAGATELILHTVTRGPFDHVVLEDGEIESSSNVEVMCEVKAQGGTGTPILWVIDEGTYVKKGDKLVELDSSALQQEMKAQRITLSTAEATVISSEATLKQAEIARQEYLDGTYLTERTTILSEIAVAEQDLRKAELSLGSAERLAAKGTLKPLQIQAEQFAVKNARNRLDSATARLKVLDELTKEKMLVQFDSNIETAKAKLDSDRSTLQEEKDKLKEIELQIANCLITAPTEGQVVHANKFSGRGGSEFIVEAGAMARERQTLIVLPDPTKMQVRAKINESRVSLVSEGMACKIRVNAVENDLLGTVTKVNKYAEPGSWFSSSVKEYATYVQIQDPPESIRTGMTAEVRIFVEQIPSAIQVPVHGVYELKGHYFCLLKAGSGFETREVKIGATNEQMVTIDTGLNEGDVVVLNPRTHEDKMDLPEIKEVDDSAKMAELAKTGAEAAAKNKVPGGPGGGGPPGGPGAGGRGPGGPGGGAPGAGGAGGGGMPSPAAMVDMTFSRNDKDSDGVLSAEEIGQIDSRFQDSIKKADTNGDGKVSKAELTAAMAKMIPRQGAGGPPGGGPPGR